MGADRRILLAYPKFPNTFWGMQYALPVLGKRSTMPPLGLMTVAAMCPESWELRLVDENTRTIEDDDLAWCDAVFVSGMLTQRETMFAIGDRARAAGKLTVFGGPFPTACPDVCEPHCDVIVAGEAEDILATFASDWERGELQAHYQASEKPDVHTTPVPRYDLIDVDAYVSLPVQVSRGCPFQCEFCDIIVLYGRRPRTKTPEQVLAELDAIYATGYRGEVFIVDDNFIGNRRDARQLLPEIAGWNEAHGNPFDYGTEASVDLARLDDMLDAMVAARFRWVFLGIETPSAESLAETKKTQNLRGSLQESVDTIIARGLYVTAGFIVGFDSDGPDIFDRQADFIAHSRIPFAMVFLLEALPGTALWDRLVREGRLEGRSYSRTQNTGGMLNFSTRLPQRALLEGYRRLLSNVHNPKALFARALDAAVAHRPPRSRREALGNLVESMRAGKRFFHGLGPILAYVWRLPREIRREALRFVWRVMWRRPDQVLTAADYTVMGTHLYRFAFEDAIPRVDAALEELSAASAEAPPPRSLPVVAAG